jgi:hypothetical protein
MRSDTEEPPPPPPPHNFTPLRVNKMFLLSFNTLKDTLVGSLIELVSSMTNTKFY